MPHTLAPWINRARPASDVLNPATGAVCVAWAAKRYQRETAEAMPWALAFLVAPLTLHAPTRVRYPRSIATHFPRWISENAEVLAGFSRRASAFVPYVQEALRYGLRSQLLELGHAGSLSATIADHTKIPEHTELRSIATASALTGGWFAKSGSVENVFMQLGVTP